MNKKGLIGHIIFWSLLVLLFISMTGYFLFLTELREECKTNYTNYTLNKCMSNLQDIKDCELLGYKWIRTERSFITQGAVYCYKGENIIKI